MRGQREGGLSAITQVKVFSPEMINIAPGQGFHFLEASTAACVSGEYVSGVPGSKSMAGNPTVHVGTWDNHIAPDGSFQQAEEARRKYGDMAVGPAHSRGVAGVMPSGTFFLLQVKMPDSEVDFCLQSPHGVINCDGNSSLEGAGSKAQRDEVVYAIH